jgi:hypothetical protein
MTDGTQVIDRFLDEAHQEHNCLVPDSARVFALVTKIRDGVADVPQTASQPPTRDYTSPFIGNTVDQVSSRLPGTWHFAILDDKTVSNGYVLLVRRNLQDESTPAQTVRVTFAQAQSELIALNIGSKDFATLVDAANSAGGVYSAPAPTRKGGPAPRKLLGAK